MDSPEGVAFKDISRPENSLSGLRVSLWEQNTIVETCLDLDILAFYSPQDHLQCPQAMLIPVFRAPLRPSWLFVALILRLEAIRLLDQICQIIIITWE